MHPFYDSNRRLLEQRDRRGDKTAGLVSMLAYLVFWAAAIPVAVRALRRYAAPPVPPVASAEARSDRAVANDPAVSILRCRYARGEIDHDEFVARLEMLRR